MPTSTKTAPKKPAEESKSKTPAQTEVKPGGEAVKQKPIDILASKASDIFAKIKAKTGIDSKKIDEFQKSWLAVPENRKKYEHIADAPEVAVEEILAMTNDIIDYCQGQDASKSHLFKNLKEKGAKFLHGSIEVLKQTLAKEKQKTDAVVTKAKESTEKAKPVNEQVKAKNNQPKAVAKKSKK
jgi:hypothetical protein